MNQPTHQQWRDEALCRQTDPEIFFPDKGQTATAAKKVCAVCPARDACLTDAITQREKYGVRGGMTPNERKTYARDTQVLERSVARWAA
jgi:WhiB family transcriptional regulator, redox-sensing transcriptional regulator